MQGRPEQRLTAPSKSVKECITESLKLVLSTSVTYPGPFDKRLTAQQVAAF